MSNSVRSKNGIRNRKGSSLLSVSIIIFTILCILAIVIILNKGKIAGYSLVKIESEPVDSIIDSSSEDTMEISVDKKYLSCKDEEEAEIFVTINGEEVDIDEVELTSSNEDAIEIEDGTAIAVSDGKSTITAKKGDLEASIDLHAIVPIKSISFTTTNSTIRVGKSLQMKLIAKPSDANISTLKYESSDEEIATVNGNGIVTGVAPGKVTITVRDEYSEIEKSVNLTIRK